LKEEVSLIQHKDMKKVISNNKSEVFNNFANTILKRFAQNAPSPEESAKKHIEVLKEVGQKTLANFLENKYVKKLNSPNVISIEDLLPAIEIYSTRYGNRSSMDNNFLGIVLTNQAKELMKLTGNEHRLPKTNEPTDPFFAIVARYLVPRLIQKLEAVKDPRLNKIIIAMKGGNGGKTEGFRPGQIERTLLATHLVDSFDLMLANYLLGLNVYDVPDLQDVGSLEEKAALAEMSRDELNTAMQAIPQGEALRNYLNWMLGFYSEQSTEENEPKISAEQFKSGVTYVLNQPIAQKLADKLDGKDRLGQRKTFIYNSALNEINKDAASQKTATRKAPSFWR